MSVAGDDYRAVRMWGNPLTPSIATFWMGVIIFVELIVGRLFDKGSDKTGDMYKIDR